MGWLYDGSDGASRQTTRSRLRAAAVHVHDAPDGQKFRGGQVWLVAGDTITLRLMAEQSRVRDYTVAAAVFSDTDAEPNVGAPIVATVTGTSPDDYVVTSVRAGRATAMGDAAASVARGLFDPALLNGCVPGIGIFQDEKA